MRKRLLLGLLALGAIVSCNKGDNDPRLVIITYDGLRWQEVFTGADEALSTDPRYVQDLEAVKAAYLRETPEQRREALLPFLWSYAPQHGYLIGNRNKESFIGVSNSMNFSYPGYSEMFCGWADDERINSNDPIPNPNVSVLEVVNADPRYKGKLMMYSSWESIRYAVNNERGGFLASSAHEPAYVQTPVTVLLQEMDGRSMPPGFGEAERDDAITCGFALETIKEAHPKVLYVGFGDTDEYGHSGRYDKYLEGAHATDAYIRNIVETCESDPFYKGKTTYLLTTDHGRGYGTLFTDHGESVRGSNETWFIAFGKGIPVLGETSHNGTFYNRQLAATIADILGVDFTPGNGEKSAPIDPTYYKEPETAVLAGDFPAIEAKPKGNGLRYTYSEGDFMSVKEVIAAPVKARGIVPVFGTKEIKKREDHFGIVFTGLMKIEKEGNYTLSFTSDDGAKVWVDGNLVWDKDRDGGGFADSFVKLGAGFHRLEVQYFENYGDDDFIFGLEGNGVAFENLPAEMLFYE